MFAEIVSLDPIGPGSGIIMHDNGYRDIVVTACVAPFGYIRFYVGRADVSNMIFKLATDLYRPVYY